MAKKPEKQRKSKIVKVVKSPLPHLYADVEIYDTVLEHIAEAHSVESTQMDAVYSTIESPSRVHKSKTHPTSVTLVNDNVTSKGGDRLRVAVKNVAGGTSLMSTAHFSTSKDQGEILWESTDAKDSD